MPSNFTTPPLAITGAVIAAADINVFRDNDNWFNQLLPQPTAANQWPQSSSTTAGAWVDRATAVLAAIGYTPLNKAGDSMPADLSFDTGLGVAFGTSGTPGRMADTSGFTFLRAKADVFRIYDAALSSIMLAVGTAAVTVLGQIQAATGAITGALTAGSLGVSGAATVGTTLGVTGAQTNGSTIQCTQLTATVSTGTAPIQVSSTTKVTNLHADVLDGSHATATPTADAIPIANGSGNLDSWITTSAGIPSRLGAWVPTAASIPSGWSRYSSLDGRIPVGAGTTFSVTFTENTNYGSSWSHTHTDSGHTHAGTALGVTGSTGVESAVNGLGNNGGTNTPAINHTHPSGTLDVSGSTDSGTASISSDAWTIPSRAVVWITKS